MPYNDNKRPSFGQIFDNIERKKAPVQSTIPEKSKPFLDLKLYEGGEKGEKLKIDWDSPELTISFWVSVENQGDIAAIVSDDSFKNYCELDARTTAIKPVSLKLKAIFRKSDKDLFDLLKEEPLEIQYRLVYYPVNTEKEFCAIEKNVRIKGNDIKFF